MNRSRLRIAFALVASVVVNVSLVGVAALLSSERGTPPPSVDTGGVSLITLAPPEPAQEEKEKPPEKPKPRPEPDFKPDLVAPRLAAMGGLDGGIAIDMGGIGTGGLQEEFVFESYELDQPPQAAVKSNPVYPFKAREQGIEGVVQVKILVNSDGSVGQVQIMAARPENVFDDAVLQAVPKWRFRPGMMEGKAVTAWVVTALKFQLN